MADLVSTSEIERAAANTNNGYIEVERLVPQADSITYVQEERDEKVWPVQETFLQHLLEHQGREAITRDIKQILINGEQNVVIKFTSNTIAQQWLTKIPAITVQTVKFSARPSEPIQVIVRPNVTRVRLWGVPTLVKDASILKKFTHFGTLIKVVRHEYCRNFPTIENGNRYLFMSSFKTRYGTPRYVFIDGVKCRVTHDGQERPLPGTKFDKFGYEITGGRRLPAPAQGKPATAWGRQMEEEESSEEETDEPRWHADEEDDFPALVIACEESNTNANVNTIGKAEKAAEKKDIEKDKSSKQASQETRTEVSNTSDKVAPTAPAKPRAKPNLAKPQRTSARGPVSAPAGRKSREQAIDRRAILSTIESKPRSGSRESTRDSSCDSTKRLRSPNDEPPDPKVTKTEMKQMEYTC